MKRYFSLCLLVLVLLLPVVAAAQGLRHGGFLNWNSPLFEKSSDAMSAFDGQISLWSNYSKLTFDLVVEEEGLYKLIVSAWGDPALDPDGAKWPHMKLSIDNKEICLWEVEGDRQLYLSPAITLSKGVHQAKIVMVNDYANDRGEDRNLFVDSVAFGKVRSEGDVPSLIFKGRPLASFGSLTVPKLAGQELAGLFPDNLATVLTSGSYAGAESNVFKVSTPAIKAFPNQLSLWSNYSQVTFMLEVEEDGYYKLLLSSWGDPATEPNGKRWPIMKLAINGKDVCLWEITGKEQELYLSPALELRAGKHEAEIVMINDFANAQGEDRNLFLGGVALGRVEAEEELPAINFAGKPLVAYPEPNAVLEIINDKKIGVPPYYPPKLKVAGYTPTTFPQEELEATLANGVICKPEEFRVTESLNGSWKFSGLINSKEPFQDDVDLEKGYWQEHFNDSDWTYIPVPKDWYRQYPQARKADAPYVKGWYRRQFSIPQAQKGKRVMLHFGVIGYDADLYVNGKLAGTHHGDFTPWEIEITDLVKFGQTNTLAIRVLSDFGPKVANTVHAPTHAYGSQWSLSNIKGGIWQDVYLAYEEPVYLKRVLVNPSIKDNKLELHWLIENKGSKRVLDLHAVVQSAMLGEKSQVANQKLGEVCLVPGTNQGTIELPLDNPQLWSPENPYLYYLTLALADGENLVAAKTERFGFREFRVAGSHFLLNGERVYLFGENIPSVNYGGNLTTEEEIGKLAAALQGFKSQGYNIVRNAHMPINREALEIADEIGLMIYNEWAWSFTVGINEQEFEKNNLKELTEWIYRDYNYPSVVMWSLGNEVRYTNVEYEQLNKQAALVRELDGQQRPICSFSGNAYGFGNSKLDTDVIDLHDYLGLNGPAWTNFENQLEKIYKHNAEIYKEDGVFDKPFIVWECVGFSWGEIHDYGFRLNDIERYAQYANSKPSWGEPNGIGLSASIGLAAALDPDRGTAYGRELYGKRIIELIRYQDFVQGFAPWFQDYNLEAATIWNQPLFVGLRGENKVALRNIFAGEDYQQTLFLVNSQQKEFERLQLKLVLVDQEGAEECLQILTLDKIAPFEKRELELKINVPNSFTPGYYQLRVLAQENGQVVSLNFYDLFVQDPVLVAEPIQTAKRVAVLEPNTDLANKFLGILDELSISYQLLSSLEQLNDYDVLIIPPSSLSYSQFESQKQTNELLAWVEGGGELLQLEQSYLDSPLGQALFPADNTYVDLAVPAHPVFEGLDQVNFDIWNNPDRGYLINYGIYPFTLNALAVRGPFLGDKDVTMAVAEGRLGKGRIFANQLLATSMWGLDSAASTYLTNVLAYILEDGAPYQNIKPWERDTKEDFTVVAERVVPIDLIAYANRGFKDEVDGDEKGGWTDQGSNDFRMMPLGSQVLAGVPFEIIDPRENNDRSCLVLKGKERSYFPEEIEGVCVDGHYNRLFFLHTLAWSNRGAVGEYIIRYADGTVEKIILNDGVNINDWWNPTELPEAKLALIKENPITQKVCLWALEWENPKPGVKIAAIDFVSYGEAVPILVAVSGEKANLSSLVIDDFETTKRWAIISDGKGGIPKVSYCDAGREPHNVRVGKKALKVEMPPKDDAGTPVTFTKFPLEKIDQGYDYVTFWIKPETVTNIRVVLPKNDWSSSLGTSLVLKAGEWQKIRLNLNQDFGLKNMNWGLEELRGEFFIYNQNTARDTVFYLDEIVLE